MDSQTKQQWHASISQASRTDAEWIRAGKQVSTTRSFPDVQHYDGWYWPGPTDEATRKEFWNIAIRAKCVVLEFLNDAILGLVWHQGYPAVVYSTEMARDILQRKWMLGQPGPLALQRVAEHELHKFDALMETDFGPTTPWFLV